MSVDLFSSSAGGTAVSVPGPITDVIIIFGGWGGLSNAEPIVAGPGSGTSELYRSLRDLPTPPGGNRREFLALTGSLKSSSGVNQGVAFLRRHFHPNGKVVIYGYSAGGTDALSLCRRINSEMRFYGFTSRRLVSVKQSGAEVFGDVRVDLLITVDAASGPGSGGIDRSVPACVEHNLNFYQSTPSGIASRGWPNVPNSPTATRVDNTEITSTSHADIDEDTNDRVLDAIRGVLGYEDTPPTFAPGSMGA